MGSYRSPATPPHVSSSTQSMDSEAPPSTPPDDPAAASDSRLTNVVLSRPSHSVPRSQIREDEKHSKEWEEMMQRSRLAEQRRREELEARRLAREFSVENTWLWERAVVPDWKKAMKDPNLRKLWWNGMPISSLSLLLERAIGNGLAFSKGFNVFNVMRAIRGIAPSKATAARNY
ncbi:hypothetical protein JB92DRAFT_3110450 [Gautieria morchelliformis]|nr:hypothetical protein JB92DRAFT_3110450 [Gautieria morchelliformis]